MRISRFRRAFTPYELLAVMSAGTLLMGLTLPAVQQASSRALARGAQNNLRMMGVGVHNIASVYNGLEPPVVGEFPKDGPKATLFFHLLPHIEEDKIYREYEKQPTQVPETTTVKIYCASKDPTNSGVKSALTSFASNAQIFGLTDGGTARVPALFNNKGTTNCVLIMERYAVTGEKNKHLWYDIGDRKTYVYPPAMGVTPWTTIKEPQFGVGPVDKDIVDDTAHAFVGDFFNVLLGDASARIVRPVVRKTFKARGIDPDPTIWAWACNVHGALGNQPTPSGW